MAGPEALTSNAILRAIADDPRIRLWRLNVGAFKTESGGFVRVGFPGLPDLVGMIQLRADPPLSANFFVEVKSATGRLSTEQAAFGEMAARMGACWVCARSVADVMVAIAAFRRAHGCEP